MKNKIMKFTITLFKQFLITLIFISFVSCQDEPVLNIHLNPPEENVKDTMAALKDIGHLEDDLRIGAENDYDDEKKKLLEIQKVRIHDIVHGAFIALNSLIPNPIKSSIRKAIRDKLKGGSTSYGEVADPTKAEEAVKVAETNGEIQGLEKKINNLRQAKFKQRDINLSKDDNFEKKYNRLFNKRMENNMVNSIINENQIKVNYYTNSAKDMNNELYNTDYHVLKPM